MSDELVPVPHDVVLKIREAGASKLNRAQTALELGMTDHELRTLMMVHPELNEEYERGKLVEIKSHLKSLKNIANNDTHIHHFQAAKYMYELLTGHGTGPTTQVNIQNVHNSNNEKLIEVLDVETIEAIKNDARSKS